MDNAYIWSAPLKPIRSRVPYWLHLIFDSPVHTFATIGSNWIASPANNRSGYWYCAGDFCATNQATVNGQEVASVDVDYARCLVKPDIDYTDTRHPAEVIGGAYGIDFVCHNIVNRILYAADPKITLVSTNIPLTGYKFIVNGPLGIYGRNDREWGQAILLCAINQNAPLPSLSDVMDEIQNIHKRALGEEMAMDVTEALADVDARYRSYSREFSSQYDDGKLNFLQFNIQNQILARETIASTESIIGPKNTRAIYGEYSTDLTSNNLGLDAFTQSKIGEIETDPSEVVQIPKKQKKLNSKEE